MATHVLVPVDGSELSWRALAHALEQFEGEPLSVLTVVDPTEGMYSDMEGGYYSQETFDAALDAGEARCEEARRRIAESGATQPSSLETAVEAGQPSRAILEFVEQHDVDHVVMGSHGRSGVSRILFGSVAETVTRRAPVPVTIVR